MKHSFLLVLAFITMIVCSALSCDKSDDNSTKESNIPMVNGKIKITVTSQTFTAK